MYSGEGKRKTIFVGKDDVRKNMKNIYLLVVVVVVAMVEKQFITPYRQSKNI